MDAITVNSVTKSFAADEGRIQALNDLSFNVAKSSLTGLVGPDGSGKTTLLRMLAGLMKPEHVFHAPTVCLKSKSTHTTIEVALLATWRVQVLICTPSKQTELARLHPCMTAFQTSCFTVCCSLDWDQCDDELRSFCLSR